MGRKHNPIPGNYGLHCISMSKDTAGAGFNPALRKNTAPYPIAAQQPDSLFTKHISLDLRAFLKQQVSIYLQAPNKNGSLMQSKITLGNHIAAQNLPSLNMIHIPLQTILGARYFHHLL